MAKVPLRTYIREIETLIERGNTDEAIAHSRHILKTYPKYLDCYRALGRAYLESKRFAEAADIFQRVLASAPDDFISHVGMSIISDDQKRQDETIWHMERAFESQPSNAAIQAELQRLYGRRDGREPHKIRLTRGALARMYVHGDLFAQAIGEIRSVLSEDPTRVDMQVLLALAFFRSGQKVEASETCSQLIGRYPYCYEANRILVEILPGTGMAESAQMYRSRVIDLDPYAAYVTGSIFQSGDVPDNSLMIERLEYKGQHVDAGPGWERNALGTAPAPVAAQPDWVKPSASESSDAPFAFEEEKQSFAFPANSGQAAPSGKPFEQPAESDEEAPIPDWMRSSGWGESSGAFDESALSAEESSSELAKADIPDWIKSMAPPAAAAAAAAPVTPSAAPDETMDWLNKLSGDQPFAEAPQESIPDSGVPDWLSSLDESTAPAATSPEVPATDLPDWVSELGTPPLKPTSTTQPPVPAPNAATPPPAVPAGLDASLGDLGTTSAEQDAAMLWLESLAAKGGAKSEELITNPDERLEKPPEWVEQARVIGESQPAESEIEAAPLEAAPPPESVWPGGEEDTGTFDSAAVPSSASDMTSAWLRDLVEQEETVKPVVEKPAWSGEIEVPPPPAPAQEAEPTPKSDLPSWLRDLETREAASAVASDDMPEWLKGGEPQEEEPLPEPTQPTDWTPELPKRTWPVEPEPVQAAKPVAFERSDVEEPEPAPAKPAAAPRKKEPRKSESAADTRLRRTGMLPPLIDPTLAAARDALEHAKIPDALQAYGNLIRKGKMLEDVTFDLKEALYRFPVEVSIWQVLGDAYMRANRLQDALDAYTKAEELLR